MATDFKQIIIDSLEVLRKRDVADKQPFKARAYAKVIAQLQATAKPITSYEDVLTIDGIGEKISEKIKEILETGSLKSAEKAKELYNITALDAFQKIYGVGPAKATELVAAGITSIAQLREELKINPKLLNDKQKAGLKHYEDLLERIPRQEMEEHRDVLEHIKPYEMTECEMEIVGSFRRGAMTSGDIDVLIRIPPSPVINETTHEQVTPAEILKKYVKMLRDFGYIKEVLALGEHKCMAICSVYNGKARRLDLLMTPDNEYAYAMLYFTGSDRFNVAFRQHALNIGYTLNEHKLTQLNPERPVPPYMQTEADIFRFLKLRYIEPSKRVNEQQIVRMGARPKVAQ